MIREGNSDDALADRPSRRPGGFASTPGVTLDPDLRADEAVRVVLRGLLEAIRANTGGTIADLGPEFLHDFRVAVRRTRSALGQMKQVFPTRPVDRFKRGFSWLGDETGPKRDLDVFLLKLDGYADTLPQPVRDDLEPVRQVLSDRQVHERHRVARVLRSTRFRNLVDAWDRFLSVPGAERSRLANARRPIRELAAERIRIAFQRALHSGEAIDDGAPAAALHRLRIDCKKLRYLLEFFRHVFDADQGSRLIAELKRLQDLLGDFNDLEVHRVHLIGIAREWPADDPSWAGTAIAAGRLVQCLVETQARERQRFRERFERFAGPETHDRVSLLFGSDLDALAPS